MDSMDYMEYWYHSMDFGNDIPVDLSLIHI